MFTRGVIDLVSSVLFRWIGRHYGTCVTFTLFPAIDVANGRAVRLIQGKIGTETNNVAPRDAALAWQVDGAQWIHLVDLDAAFGRGTNAELLASVIGELDVNVQLSGGVHDDESLQRALATGCARVILATTALDDPVWCARAIARCGERIAFSLDVRVDEGLDGSQRHGLVARGSTGDRGDLWETLERLDSEGCARYVVTDISRDGTLLGPNVDLYRAVSRATRAAVIASGGISSISDLVVLAETASANPNLEGAVIGKAFDAGRFTLPDALRAVAAHG